MVRKVPRNRNYEERGKTNESVFSPTCPSCVSSGASPSSGTCPSSSSCPETWVTREEREAEDGRDQGTASVISTTLQPGTNLDLSLRSRDRSRDFRSLDLSRDFLSRDFLSRDLDLLSRDRDFLSRDRDSLSRDPLSRDFERLSLEVDLFRDFPSRDLGGGKVVIDGRTNRNQE